jgi:hypothetical protein
MENVLPATSTDASLLPIYIDATAQRTWSGPGMYAESGALDQSSEIWTAAGQHKPRKR